MNHVTKLAFCLLLASCGGPTPTGGERSEMDTAVYKLTSLNKSVGDCSASEGPPCAEVYLSYLVFEDLPVKKSRDLVDSLCSYFSSYSSREQAVLTSPEAVVDTFFAEFNSILRDFPDYKGHWELQRNARVHYNKNGLLGLTFSEYSYAGGAHGLYVFHFRLVDLPGGKVLSYEDLMVPDYMDNFRYTAEMAFRRQREIPDSASLNAHGYWFENDQFKLTDNFRLDPEGIVFFWNPYDIAPYSEGNEELLLPWETLQPFLNEEFSLLLPQ